MGIEDFGLFFKILGLLMSSFAAVCQFGVYDENVQWVCLCLYFILLNWSSDYELFWSLDMIISMI